MTQPYTWMNDIQKEAPRKYSDAVRLHVLNELYTHLVHVSGEHGAATDVFRRLVLDAQQLAAAQERITLLEDTLLVLYDGTVETNIPSDAYQAMLDLISDILNTRAALAGVEPAKGMMKMSSEVEKALLKEVDFKLNTLVAERDEILKRYAVAVASERYGIHIGDMVKGVDGYGDYVLIKVAEPYWFYLDGRNMELWFLGENLKRIRAANAVKVDVEISSGY